MKKSIAIVHEWFVNYMGSEKCVNSFLNIWPEADLFSMVDFLTPQDRDIIINGKNVQTSFIQNLPFAKKYYRNYLPLFPLAVEQLDVSNYDVIISSSHLVAKGALTNTNQLHFCYCHTPVRYAWDLYFQYLRESNLEKGLKSLLVKWTLHRLRLWDIASSSRVDHYIANSNHIRKRINKIYRRDADVIYPPVDVQKFPIELNKEDYYLTVSRFVPYKKIDLIISAFSRMKDKKLIVIGDGPELSKIKSLATSNIEIISHQTDEQLVGYMQKAKAFLFAAEEDFGITIVESQACGTPVIAYGVGGSSETVLNNETGILFDQQSEQSILDAVKKFENNIDSFNSSLISNHAQKFSKSNFEQNIKNYVEQKSSKMR